MYLRQFLNMGGIRHCYLYHCHLSNQLFTVALDVDALLDLFTLRPCTDLATLGVAGMSLSK